MMQFLGGLLEDHRLIRRMFASHPGPSSVETEHGAHIGSMASGSFVVKDGEYMRSLLDKTSKLLALDMESYGVATAAKMCSSMRQPVNWLVVKGVADYGDSLKADDWHEYCCFVSARFARLGLELLLKRDKAYQLVNDRRNEDL